MAGRFSLWKPIYGNYASEMLDTPASGLIPYLCHFNEDTIITKSGDLISAFQVGGFPFETADDYDLDAKKQERNNLIKGMDNPNLEIMSYCIRSQYSAFPEGEFPKGMFSEMLNKSWKKKQTSGVAYINEHFVTIRKKSSSGPSSLLSNLSNLLHGGANDGKAKAMMESYAEFEEMKGRLYSGLAPYKPTKLGVRLEDGHLYSDVAEFLGRLINGGYKQKMLLPRIALDKYLATSRLYFGDRLFEVSAPDYRKFGAIVSIKEYRPSTSAGIFDNMMLLPFNFIMTNSFGFIDRLSAISKMRLQQTRLEQSGDVAVSQIQEISEAMDAATGGVFAFGRHHCSVAIFGDTQKQLDSNVSNVVVEFANCGITAVREKANMEASYWAQLPGNSEFAIRAATINTLNYAGFASFHNYPAGKAKKNHWGNAITVLPTTSKTLFNFSFHDRDIGHTLLIGPTGAGKTVNMNMLVCQLQKTPRLRTIMFDKDRGSEICIKGMGGRHVFLDPAKPCYLNPLHMEDTGRTRAFLGKWFKILLTANGETLVSSDYEAITFAIDGCFRLPKEERRLRNVAPFFGIEKPGSLAGRLKQWHSDGSKANIFDNEYDAIDFSKGSVFGFEMAEMFKDDSILVPVFVYLMERIWGVLDGRPMCVVVDEAWAMFKHETCQEYLMDILKVWRKLNGMIVMATQSVEDAAKSKISDTLIQQTATQIFLPNPKATIAYREVFMLSEREFQLVKGIDPASRYFLVKQSGQSIVVKADLAGMTDEINVLSGRAETAILLDKIIAKTGPDPREWLPIFLRDVKAGKAG